MRAACISVALFLVAGCTTHIAPYRPKKRRFPAGSYDKARSASGASIYAQSSRGLFEDARAAGIGDIIIIRINENETATRSASTKLARKNQQDYGISASMGILDAIAEAHPSINPAALIGGKSEKAFEGAGNIARSGKLAATLPVRVRRVLPNGDYFVEGTKVIMVDNEEHHLYVSGIVRRVDLDANNSVSSSRLADAEIEYTGRGDVSAQQRPGWFSRLLTAVWPF